MKIKKYMTVLTVVAFLSVSCMNNHNRVNANKKENEEQVKNSDPLNAGIYISKSILGENMGIKSISSSELNSLNYNQLFSPKGILDIVVYFDKHMKPLKQPTKFEDFLLIVVNYEDSQNAKNAFDRIKSDAKLSNTIEQTEIDEKLNNRIALLKLGKDYGGLITYNESQVFSLIENCDTYPLDKSWLEIEYLFTDLLKNQNGFVEVLKAGCGEGRYYGGRRKASS